MRWFSGAAEAPRAAEQKSPAMAGGIVVAYAATGATRCVAAASSTIAKHRFRFIARHSSSRIRRVGPGRAATPARMRDDGDLLHGTTRCALTRPGQSGSIGLTT
jgi:hypothetical protein